MEKLVIGTCAVEKEDVIRTLEKQETIIFATCADNRVTTRYMSHVNDGLNIYFQTGNDYLKMQQIRKNPNVAVSVGTYDIEGTAVELGHPLSGENELFVRLMKAKHPAAFKTYSSIKDECVVKVTVRGVRQWRYIDGKPFLAEGKF
jgi:uncharacterized pyridoxamine 5'-phosphate oxidase family protein